MSRTFQASVLRYEFYRWTLREVGQNVVIDFGTIFNYRDVRIGDHDLIGKFNVVHHCDFGSYVMTGERCTFLSGSHDRHTEQRNIPMALQGGQMKRITIEDDVWIGVHSVIADNVGSGSIIAIGTVITNPVPSGTSRHWQPCTFPSAPSDCESGDSRLMVIESS